MRIRFAKSSRRHRIGHGRALYVMATSDAVESEPDGNRNPRYTWIGNDDRGLELEVVAVLNGDDLLVIHVMPRSFRRAQ